MTLKRQFCVGLVVVVLIAAIPQAVLAGPLNISGNTTFTTSTNYQGGLYTSGDLTFNDGVTVTLDGPPATYNWVHGGQGWRTWNAQNAASSATLVNEGTWTITNRARGCLDLGTGQLTIENKGVMDLSWDTGAELNNGHFYANTIGGRIINTGTFRYSGTQWFNSEMSTGGEFIISNGTVETTGGGKIYLVRYNGTMTNACYNGTFDTSDGGTIYVGRKWSELTGNAVGNPLYTRTACDLIAGAATTTVEIAGAGLTLDSTIDTGGKVIVHGTNGIINNGKSGAGVLGNGTFRNYGTWNQTVDERMGFTGSSTTFENAGTMNFNRAGAWSRGFWVHSGAGGLFHNLPDGQIIRMNSSYFQFNGAAGHQWDFRNEGTLVASNGYWEFHVNGFAIDINTLENGELKEGTWRCLDGGDINFNTSYAGNIDTIGTDATVVLRGSGSTIDRLTEASLTTINGTFGLHKGRTWTSGGVLTNAATTRYEFGLDNTGTDAQLIVGASSDLQGAIDIVDLGTLQVGSYTVIVMSAGQDLTDVGITEGTLTLASEENYLLSLTKVEGTDGYIVANVESPPPGVTIIVR